MENFFSFKIKLKRVCLGILIGIFLCFLAGLIYYYFVIYRPFQEKKKNLLRMNEFEKQFYEKKGLPLPKDF